MSRINKQANPKFSEVEKWWHNYGDAIHKMNTLGKRYGQDLTKEYHMLKYLMIILAKFI